MIFLENAKFNKIKNIIIKSDWQFIIFLAVTFKIYKKQFIMFVLNEKKNIKFNC